MRKARRGSALILAAAMAGLGIGSKAAFAQFAWDPQQTPLIPSGGSGTWDNTTLNWSNGISDVAWNSSIANFGAPGGVVTIGAPISASAINLNAGGYTFSTSNPANILSLSSGTLTQAAGISGINELAGPVNFSNSTVNINAGTLKLSNTLTSAANSITNTNFNVASGSTLEFNAVTGPGALGNGSIVLNGGTLQIDPTATGVAGSYNSHFITSGNSNTTNVDYYAKAINGSPSTLNGPINFNPNFAPPSPFYPGGPVSTFAARFAGAINIATAGQYTFSTLSDDGSRLYIDNQLVVMNDGSKTALSLTGAPVALSAGLHEFRLDYTQVGGSDELNLNYGGPDTGNNMSLVPASAMQTLDTISLSNNISVTTNSTMSLAGSNFTQVGMGQLTFNGASGGATLNINGDPGRSLHFSGILVAGTDTINTTATVFAGQFNSGQTPTLIKTGTGTLIFDNTASTNGAGGIIDIQQGTVEIIDGNTTTTGTNDPIGAASLKIDGGTLEYDSKLALDGAFEPANVTVTSAGGTLESAETMTAVLAGPLQLNGNLKIATASGNATSIGSSIRLSGVIAGTGNIEKVPSQFTGDTSNQGTLELGVSSPNWSGSLTLDANAGSIQGDFNNIPDKPFGTNAITLHGGAISFVRHGSEGVTYTPGNDVNADGDFALNTGTVFAQPRTYFQLGHLTLTGSRTVTQSGDFTTGVLFTGTTLGGDATVNVASSLVLGPVSESAPSSLTKMGVGTLAVASATYTGSTSIQQGTIQIGSGNALPSTTLNIAQGTLDLNGHDQSVAHLSSTSPYSGSIVAGSVTNGGSGLSTLSILGDSNFSGSISDGGSGKAVALNIIGGATTLSGINNYTGGTVVHSGARLISELSMAGPSLGSGAVTLAGGALSMNGQQRVVATAPGLSAQLFYIVPNQMSTSNGTINANFSTLTSFTSHLQNAPGTPQVQTTANGKDNFDFSNASVSKGAVTGVYTTQPMFGTPPSSSNDTTADYGFLQNQYFEVRFSGYINVPQAGLATFATTSDDGSMIWLDNNDAPVVNNNFWQGATTRSGTYDFTTPGLHPITIGYFQGPNGEGLNVSWTPPGASSSHTLLNSETATGSLVTAPVQTYANDLVVSGDSSIDVKNSLAAVMGNLSIGAQLSLTSSDTSGSPYSLTLGNVTLTGNSNFNVASSAGGGAGTLTLGPITNTGAFNVTKTGAGTLVLTGNNSSPGLTSVQGGLLDVEGSIHTSGLNVMGGAVLGGKGTVLDGAVAIHSNAALVPSLVNFTPAGGPFTIQGNLSFDDSSAKLVLDLAGVTPGSGYDQLRFGSTVSLNGATLILNDSTQTQALPAVQRFWILDGLPGSSVVNGQLSYQGQLLADGSTFTDSAGQQFMIDYNAAGDPNGTGNDILLSTTPEPAGIGLLLASATGLLQRRRRVRESA